MILRVTFHVLILLYSILIAQTASIIPFILPVFFISLIGACRNRSESFSVTDMFWLLFQLSFVAAPARTFRESTGDVFFSNGVIVDYWMGKVMIYNQDQLIVLFIIITIVAFINLLILPSGQQKVCYKDINIRLSLLALFVVVFGAFLVDLALRGGIENVLSARHERNQEALSIFAIFSGALFLSAFWLTAIKLNGLPGYRRTIGLTILIIPVIVLYNPFNAARFGIIQAWLPFFIIIWPSISRVDIFLGLILVGVVVFMPILSLTTRYGIGSDITKVDISLVGFLEFLDQHMVSLHLIDMVDRNGYQFGSSTISVLGFFIPRALWPEKPNVIGLHVGEELYEGGFVGTPNLSGPIFLDFYYDFGFLGVVFGSVLTAIVFRRIIRQGGRVNGVPLVEYIILGALPILFRGSVGAVIGVVFFSLTFHYIFVYFFGRVERLKQ